MRTLHLASLPTLLLAGCMTALPTSPRTLRATGVQPKATVVQAAHAETPTARARLLPPDAAGAAVTLDELLELASRHHPELAIARTQIDAARGKLVQAGLYPNPTFTWEADDMFAKAHGAGTQGPIVAQQIVTAGKLRYARAAAAQGVATADWQALTRWFEVSGKVRQAYFEALAAQDEAAVHEEVKDIARLTYGAAEKLLKAGLGNQPDVLQAKVEWQQSMIRLEAAKQREALTRQQLACAIGIPILPGAIQGTLKDLVPKYDWHAILERTLTVSSHIQEAQANIAQADLLLARAWAERVPNVNVSVRPFYDFTNKDWQLRVEVGAAIPVFHRNQGNILTARADVDRAHHELRKTELVLTERLAAAYQRYQTGRMRKHMLEKGIDKDGADKGVLEDAAESLRLIKLGYDRGDPKYSYVTLLAAQRTLAETKLLATQNLGELRKAASEIMTLIQVDPPRE